MDRNSPLQKSLWHRNFQLMNQGYHPWTDDQETPSRRYDATFRYPASAALPRMDFMNPVFELEYASRSFSNRVASSRFNCS